MNTEPAAQDPTAAEQTAAEPTAAEPTAAEQTGAEPTAAVPTETTVETAVSIRRVPKYPRFIILGGGLGAIVTFILTASFPSDPTIGFGALFGYFLIFGVPIGIVLGGLLAIGLDLAWRRRAREAIAAHTTVDALPYEGELLDDGSAAADPDAADPDATGPDAAGPDAAGPDATGPDAADAPAADDTVTSPPAVS